MSVDCTVTRGSTLPLAVYSTVSLKHAACICAAFCHINGWLPDRRAARVWSSRYHYPIGNRWTQNF